MQSNRGARFDESLRVMRTHSGWLQIPILRRSLQRKIRVASRFAHVTSSGQELFMDFIPTFPVLAAYAAAVVALTFTRAPT